MSLGRYCPSVSVITMPGSFQSWLLVHDAHATLKRRPVKGLGLKYFLCVNLFLQGRSIRSPFYEKQRNLQLSSKYSLEYRSLDRNHTGTSDQTKCTKLPGCHPCWQVKQSPEDTSVKRFDSAALVEAWLVLASVEAAEWRECQVLPSDSPVDRVRPSLQVSVLQTAGHSYYPALTCTKVPSPELTAQAPPDFNPIESQRKKKYEGKASLELSKPNTSPVHKQACLLGL